MEQLIGREKKKLVDNGQSEESLIDFKKEEIFEL